MDFHKLILDARTCRRFKGDSPVTHEQLVALIDAVRLVPSGKNAQPLRYAIVSSPAKNAEIYPNLIWAAALKEWDGPVEAERPTGYIVIGTDTEENENPAIDLGIAMQTIQLMATHMGLACCMIASIKPKNIHEIVEFPEKIKVLTVMAVGAPVEVRDTVPAEAGGKLVYYRTEDQVHHVPKYTLDTVLLKSFK